MINRFTNPVTLVLIAALLAWFAYSSFRVDRQARQITQLIDDQSPLIFAFENTGTQGRISFTVTCDREESGPNKGKYRCVTQQTQPVVANLTPVPTPQLR